MNTPVSFSNAKLIKEKAGTELFSGNMAGFTMNKPEVINLPTIAEVVMWLYEKYGIWIEVSCHTVLDEKDDDVDVFYFVIRKLKPVNILYSGDFVNSPTEAYEAAILYTLKNLIP